MLVPPLPLPVNLHRKPGDPHPPVRWLWLAAGDLAERQHGVVAREQLQRLGSDQWCIDALVRRRALRTVHRGVYAVGHRSLTHDGRRLAALLACGDAALGRFSAGAVWRFVTHDEDRVHVVVPRDIGLERPCIAAYRSSTLTGADVTTFRGLALTRPARTLVDLAAVAPEALALQAADTAMRGRCSPAQLRAALERCPRQPGRRLMLAYLGARRASALRLRSELERRNAELVLASDLPPPRFNALVDLGGERLELDAWWREQGVVLELDGRAYHEGVVAELEDERRERVIRGAGLRLERAAWWDVTREPGRLLSRLGRHLRR